MFSKLLADNWQYPAKKAACFTGHRPEKIPGYDPKNGKAPDYIESFLRESVEDCIKNGVTLFYTGLAKGVDLWAGEIVSEYTKNDDNLFLVGVQPFPDHGNGFGSDYGKLFEKVLKSCDVMLCTSEVYFKGSYIVRDKFMVEHSSRCIAVCDTKQTDSGTYYTLMYAKKLDLDIKLLNLNIS